MRTTWAILFGVAALSVAGSASAVPFFTDDFEYADGALTTVSAGAWATHSGTAAQMQVLDQEAVVVLASSGATEDVNRVTGSTLAAGATWYYGATFTVEDTRATPGTGTISNQYLMHFKDSGTFNFRGRLYLTAGSTAASYTLGVTSSSGTFNGTTIGAKWGEDLTFGQEYTLVVSYQASLNDPVEMIPDPLDPPNTMPNPNFTGPLQPGDGYASLWINPATVSSTKVTDTNPPANVGTDLQTGMSALALRQGGNGPARFDVDVVSVGNNFDEVLAAVAGPIVPPTDDADFDADGDVDGEDFLIFQRGLGVGTTLAEGDANDDNVVNAADLQIFRDQFGPGAAVGAIGAVPEPACLALAAFGLVAAAAVGRRRDC